MVAAHEKLFADSGMEFILGSAVPELDGIGHARVWNSETILRLERLPEELLVLGGGYVGCEFANMFAVFDTRVTLLQGSGQLLPREDPDVAVEVAEILRGPGVDVRLGVRAVAVRREPGHAAVVVTLADGLEIRSQELLLATGRWRRRGQPAVHPRVLARLPSSQDQPRRWRRRHHGPARVVPRLRYSGCLRLCTASTACSAKGNIPGWSTCAGYFAPAPRKISQCCGNGQLKAPKRAGNGAR